MTTTTIPVVYEFTCTTCGHGLPRAQAWQTPRTVGGARYYRCETHAPPGSTRVV